ncbi:MAG: glycosyltransferase [Planctomycetota bacterium]|jgi:glycosyltransferase involved in cell wall biosynthesis
MRICYIALGTFRHIEPYLSYFNKAGHDVHFISLCPGPDYGVPTYNLGLGSSYSRTKGKWKYPVSMFRARKLVRQLKPDILHTHYVTSGGLAGLVCNFHPTITTTHGSDLATGMRSPLRRILLRAVFKQADCINTVSEDLKEKAMSLGVEADKICVLTPGVDIEAFEFCERPPLTNNRPVRLVSTRRFEKAFDHETAIAALAIVQSKGVPFHMTFVAGGSLLEKVKKQVRNLGLDRHVRFLGGVPKVEIPAILREDDVFLSTPLWDGISVALLEAMATGLFPIASDLKVNSDWIEDGVGGLLHKVGDPHSLAACIEKVFNNPRLFSSSVRHNREKVKEFGGTQKNMRELEKVYERLGEQARTRA